jgi:hypothetical protein
MPRRDEVRRRDHGRLAGSADLAPDTLYERDSTGGWTDQDVAVQPPGSQGL